MTFVLGERSREHLAGVHPDLIRLAEHAIGITKQDFAILHGMRTKEQEAVLVAKHASTTMHSRHLPNKQGFACAIDVGAFVNGRVVWEPVALYARIADAFRAASRDLRIPVEWGGDWQRFKDCGHFQLPWNGYP